MNDISALMPFLTEKPVLITLVMTSPCGHRTHIPNALHQSQISILTRRHEVCAHIHTIQANSLLLIPPTNTNTHLRMNTFNSAKQITWANNLHVDEVVPWEIQN